MLFKNLLHPRSQHKAAASFQVLKLHVGLSLPFTSLVLPTKGTSHAFAPSLRGALWYSEPHRELPCGSLDLTLPLS